MDLEYVTSGRPGLGEYAAYAQPDIDLVGGDDIVAALNEQIEEVVALFSAVSDSYASNFRYAPGKWTLKQLAGHLADDERIFAYRILCLARNEPLDLPGFDEKLYVDAADFNQRPLADLVSNLRIVRQCTLSLLKSLPKDAWLRRGIVNGYPATVRGLAFHIAGHELHHLAILRLRYLVAGAAD